MTYVISVGGDPLNPNPFTYSQISMTSNIALVWPSNNQDPTYTATDWIDITSSLASLIVTMPPANDAGTGQEVVFNNYGAQTIIVNNADGANITTSTSGSTIRIWITDNSTSAGTWRVANIGSGTTSAVASMLAGYGIIAQAGTLSQSMTALSYSTNVTLNAGARASLVKWTGGAGTFTLSSPATLGSNWFTDVNNAGSGILTINGNGATIDNNATVNVAIGQGFTIATDGSNFYTSGKPPAVTTSYTLLTKSVGGGVDVTLSSAEAAYSIIYFTGVLTANINVIVPAAVNEWIMFNNTSGAYTLTVKTPSGTGVPITQGTRRILNSDGTDVNYSDSVGTGTVTSISTGTGLSGGPITSSGTITLANTAVNAGTYGSASKTITFAVNAQGQLTSATDSPINVSSVVGILPVANGGWGLNTLTANNVVLGNGTSAPQFVAPGSSGNILTSNGTTWTGAAYNLTGPVTSVGRATTITTPFVLSTQPGFYAQVTSVLSNVTGDGTSYQVPFGTEQIDRANNYASPIFTAPTTGFYACATSVQWSGQTPANTTGYLTIDASSGQSISYIFNPGADISGSGANQVSISGNLYLTLSQTVSVSFRVFDSTKTISIVSGTFSCVLLS